VIPNPQVLFQIDATCINEKDLEERINQVGMMTDPYTSAKTVIAWLGEEDSSTGLAFELLGTLRASLLVQPDSLLLEAKEDEESFTRHKESSIEDEELLEGFKEFGMSHRDELKGREMQDEEDKFPDDADSS
jgi:hypothetical protein